MEQQQGPPPVAPRRGQAIRPPRIKINVPPPYAASIPTATYTAQTTSTMKGPGGQPVWPSYANPFNYMYSQKAGEFMSKQFDGFMSTAKSGMSFGEKSVLWCYEKISKWSKQWFTHIFLFVVVVIYTIVGAVVFQAIEGPAEIKETGDLKAKRYAFVAKLRELSENQEIHREPKLWEGQALRLIADNLDTLSMLQPVLDEMDEVPTPTWSLLNSMVYCGTIYTTIVVAQPPPGAAESEPPSRRPGGPPPQMGPGWQRPPLGARPPMLGLPPSMLLRPKCNSTASPKSRVSTTPSTTTNVSG